ncbi:ABC transporter substrate-binding protein [Kaistia sp. 32K]|uniref:ABC transporter substrate-binding protein n=1 Tax=Kaistia sp. 32K TaxID=2795690 RepID=UPI001916A4DB|nr:ABC transporter substrate-binding protein [Kaistia sp. 32K]BCP52174.1 ABC transporter substrate-binding protein [Kaistia sp. 32K]
MAALAAAPLSAVIPVPKAWAQTKTLRIAAGEADNATGTLDPAKSTNDPDAARTSLVFERLVVLDDTFAAVPQLAKSWESNATGDEWTFKLQEGVKFHDGEPLTAKHVIYTFKRLLDPKTASPGASSMATIDPAAITALDDLTVRFKLKKPTVEFPELIANRFTYILREGQPESELRTAAIGTGPFKVQRFVPGDDVSTFVKNENYWRPGLPKVDVVELRSIPEESARIAAIESGQIDLVWDLGRAGVAGLQQNPDVKVVRTRAPFVLTLSAWADTPPFDDVRVRQAMKYVVDREQMLQLVLRGYGNIGDDNPVAPWVKYALEAKTRERDVEKAKALLAEAGHPDGIDIELFTSETVPGFIEMATLYQAMASEAGIRVKINKAPANDYWSAVWLKQPFICSSWSGRGADDALAAPYLSTSEWNETHWKRPEFDAFIEKARATTDVAERTKLYQQAQQLLRDDGGAIISMFPDALAATRANVSGWKPHPQQSTKDFSQVEIG